MTLSLDDVRNKRFRMARKSGYEVLEVDEFVDEVEATFEQLFEENQNLKKQVESLKGTSAAPTAAVSVSKSGPAAASTSPAQAATPATAAERIVVTTSKEASSAVVRLVELSTEQSERLVAEAKAEADRIREEASSKAEQLQADAQGRAAALDQELGSRGAERFGDLEKQREQLSATVNALRAFEATYRSNLTQHLKDQIEALATGSEEPPNPPAALSEGATLHSNGAASGTQDSRGDGSTGPRTAADESDAAGSAPSETPRLDALLGDQR